MRPALAVLGVIILTGAGCTRRDSGRDASDKAAREAGRAAYQIQRDSEKAAKELGHDLRNAGKQAREGWNEASREDRSRRQEPAQPGRHEHPDE